MQVCAINLGCGSSGAQEGSCGGAYFCQQFYVYLYEEVSTFGSAISEKKITKKRIAYFKKKGVVFFKALNHMCFHVNI